MSEPEDADISASFLRVDSAKFLMNARIAAIEKSPGLCQPVGLQQSCAHSCSLSELFDLLDSDHLGLTEEESRRRLVQFGNNKLPPAGRTNLLHVFFLNFVHVMALLLWAAGAIALIANMPALGLAIWTVNVVNGLFSFWQEFKAERATAALQSLLPEWAVVIRQGETKKIPVEDVVPGDILIVSTGDKICADARLIEQSSITIDQSTLTGESLPVRKNTATLSDCVPVREASNMLFAGCSVLSGHGRGIVTATGAQTNFGSIAKLTSNVRREPSPLEQEMRRVSRRISFLAVAVGISMFLAAELVTNVNTTEAFLFALGMIVAFVPEGMVPTVTLSLAIAVKKMAGQNALVKKLSAVETLGCTTIICTDKTGTLTQNEMTARHVWLPDSAWKVLGNGYNKEGSLRKISGQSSDDMLREILTVAALCNDAYLQKSEVGEKLPEGGEKLHVVGDSTEAALLVLCNKACIDWQGLRKSFPRIDELPFDRERKRMTTIHEMAGERVALIKGAPQEFVRRCKQWRLAGITQDLTDENRSHVLRMVDTFSRAGLRVLAFGRKVLSDHEGPADIGKIEQDIEFLGLIALFDPPRPEVRDAVHHCHQAGIRVVMFTGDYGLTAESIARHVDILQAREHSIISGAELDQMTDSEVIARLNSEVIFARVSPKHKLRVVKLFQELGHVVAVTGDGVNDAPALRQSNIGIAMGVRGTDVARAAADVILLDDNFATIIKAIELGRAVYSNIRKFATYVFTSNMAEAVPFALMLLSRGAIPLPLTLMQVLAVDLGTDMLPAIGLGVEAPEPGCMQKQPRRLQEPLLSRQLLVKALLWYGAIEAIAGVSCYFFANWIHGWPVVPLAAIGTSAYASATTMTLMGIVATQAGVVICCRSDTESHLRGLFENRLILVGVAVEFFLVALMMYIPQLQTIFSTAPVGLAEICFAASWTFIVIVLDEGRRRLTSGRSP
jgi:P-type Ca2+ transporter type 2C